MRPIVLDSGFFLALERGDRRAVGLAKAIETTHVPTHVPAGVIAQVWRGSPRQHRLAKLLKSNVINVEPLDIKAAKLVSALLAERGGKDVTDAHLVVIAQRLNAIVYTSDDDDINSLDATLRVVHI